ncbi:hypothetical protein RRF57_013255 [Xylaria bambusicola]|uniref:Uncharacterized protein n=1 Tax=Xylaria bambusicola TaxID=326684 RepID=A0AAN7URG1_9PEZI
MSKTTPLDSVQSNGYYIAPPECDSTINEKYAKKEAANFEKDRARPWADVRRLAPTYSGKQQDSTSGTSNNDVEKPVGPLVLAQAREAVERYIETCEEEIENIREASYKSWFVLSCGLETIDCDYKTTRDIVRRAIDAANTKDTDGSRRVNVEAEEAA